MSARRAIATLLGAVCGVLVVLLALPDPAPSPLPQTAPLKSPAEAAAVKEHAAPPLAREKSPVPPASPAGQPAALQGWVLGPDEAPVPGAVVAAYEPDRGAVRVTTGGAGEFRFESLPDGAYRVSAGIAGYNETVLENVRTGTIDLRLVLTLTSAVRGRVVEQQSGAPLASFAVVYLEVPPADAAHWQVLARATTTRWEQVNDAQGAFLITDVASGRHIAVGARAPGFQPNYTSVIPLAPGQTSPPITLALLPAAAITGRVVDAARAPIEGVAIHLGDDTRKPIETFSDARGQFQISELTVSPVELTAAQPGYVPRTVTVTPSVVPAAFVEIVLGRGGVITGRVTREGQSLPGQLVVVSTLGPEAFREEVKTQAAGEYTFSGVPPGEVEVFAELAPFGADPLQRLQRRVAVADDATTEADFDFRAAQASLEGFITADGAPPAEAEVRGTISSEGGDSFFSVEAAADGSYRAERLTPGRAWINVHAVLADGRERSKQFELSVPAGQALRRDVTLDAAGGVTGTVSGMRAGEHGEVMAVAGQVQVDLSDTEGLLALQQGQAARADLDASGGFSLEGLDAGEYTVIAFGFDPEAEDALASLRATSANISLQQDELLHVSLSLGR
ncbi:MAG: carboxypeptidase regulatory-like domain-containing protein [Candidatus Hydrogenedentes bacterium]|nr:carboxypeptidase regulatory-like domain-containing protein [Candidatus Hydrogenedentota bacterium]